VLPEAPNSLDAVVNGGSIELTCAAHGGKPTQIRVERQNGNSGAAWEVIATLPARVDKYSDSHAPASGTVCYRVRALNHGGSSAYSNIARIER
jgi:large repetitive protein